MNCKYPFCRQSLFLALTAHLTNTYLLFKCDSSARLDDADITDERLLSACIFASHALSLVLDTGLPMPFQSYTPELDEMFVFSALSALFDFSSERCPHPQKSLMGIWLKSHSADLLARQDRAQLITTIKSGVFSMEKLEKLRGKSIVTTAYHKKAWGKKSSQEIEEERVALRDMRSKNSKQSWETMRKDAGFLNADGKVDFRVRDWNKRKEASDWNSDKKKAKRKKGWNKRKADPSWDSKAKKAERSTVAKKRGDNLRRGDIRQRKNKTGAVKWVSISMFMFIKCLKA